MAHNDNFVLYFIRHENRFPHGLADCSLTNDGIYSAKYEIPNVMNGQSKVKNIYCSPLLRTCQTIYQYAKTNDYPIKLEQSLYEFTHSWTSHYTALAKNQAIPQINKDSNDVLCLYKLQYDFLSKIRKNIDTESKNPDIDMLRDLKLDLNHFLAMINDDHYTYITKFRYHYDKKITTVMDNITFCILYIDGMIVGKMPRVEIPSDKKPFDMIINLIDESLNILKSYDITKCIDKSYQSSISISDHLVEKDIETFDDLINRTKTIVDLMMDQSEYQDSIYVSHLTTINALITNIFKYMSKDDVSALQFLNHYYNKSYESFDSFCKLNQIPIGSIHKITINKSLNRVIIDHIN